MAAVKHPRARFITVYGRKPVLEALGDRRLVCHRLRVATGARGDTLARILAVARERKVAVERVPAAVVSRLSRRPNQDQGVVLDVEAPHMDDLASALAGDAPPDLYVLPDGLTTPANLGLLLRSCVAAQAALVLPGRGVPDLGPRVIKASAGTAWRATVLRSKDAATAADTLAAHGVALVGLDAAAPASIYDGPLPSPLVWVVGGETGGISPALADRLDQRRAIPMAPTAESLNAAVAASIALFETRRRRPFSPSRDG